MTIAPRLDGYYDEKGEWQRTKFCHVSCGDRCTCMPPMGRTMLPLVPQRPKGHGHPWLRNREALARMQAEMDALRAR